MITLRETLLRLDSDCHVYVIEKENQVVIYKGLLPTWYSPKSFLKKLTDEDLAEEVKSVKTIRYSGYDVANVYLKG